MDTTPRYKHDNQTRQFRNQRTVTVVEAREIVGSQTNQNVVECDDERVALANLIANLKLDVDENKKIQKQLKKANTTLTHELTECKSILAKTNRTPRDSNSICSSCLIALQNKQTKFKSNNMQTQTFNTLHNAIMEAGSKDRPPMLTPGNYVQWKSIIKRYIDTKPNHELIYYCLTNPLYELGWKEKFVLDSEGNPTTTTEKVFETYKTVTQDIRDQLNAEAETIQIILTGIDNDIYSIVDACPNACEMWKAIERLKQGESINVQDLETNLFWEFEKFTSQDGESLES
nr:hypothetical protein [Tanacetum cinerariifolium]